MELRRSTITWYIFLLAIFPCFFQLFCCDRDIIEYNVPIRDGETLVSAGKRFELGFFPPNQNLSKGRYVGIWYKFSPDTVVWVANRDDPVTGSKGVFRIKKDGNLEVFDESKAKSHWSTRIKSSKSPNLTAKLMDSGNLVLGKTQWQSFDEPTDTFLPGMHMGSNLQLTSWREKHDPGTGPFTFKQDDQERKTWIIVNRSALYWTSRGKFASSDKMAYLLSKFNLITPVSNKTSFLPPPRKKDYYAERLVIGFDGRIEYLSWDHQTWNSLWSAPADRCSIFNACGDFGSCNVNNASACKCLQGFKPVYPKQWNSGDFSSGCTREGTQQTCGEIFLNLTMMNVEKPELPRLPVTNETQCRKECLDNCQCKAYSFQAAENSTRRGNSRSSSSFCWMWHGQLRDLQDEYAGGQNLSVRVAPSNLESGDLQPSPEASSKKSTPPPLIAVPTVASVAILACVLIAFIVWRRKKSKKQDERRSKYLLRLDTQKRIKHLINSGDIVEEDEEAIDVPFFDFESIIAATNDFSDANKLGEGGYGPVYKGMLPGGQEIAVKRLSNVSGQGVQEFKNEIVLIAKLQHRNLVRLRGYCIKGDEKILLYEYMPNKSLDYFIFDNTQRGVLDWEKRFDIVLGIARGLLYLHQDSRLRIIHRDLKTSNILLDEEMEPKISDFGLARVVGGKQIEANTIRVVGTYGYMSPEYALEGLFSIKSDVFSFGVVLLEIISGKKNTKLVQSQQPLSLLGYAWKLWTENKVLDLMDPALHDSYKEDQFKKCVKVALLCVQEDPSERPTMSTVVTMLDSELAMVPTPQQPAFVLRRGSTTISSSSSSKPQETHAEITVTYEEGR